MRKKLGLIYKLIALVGPFSLYILLAVFMGVLGYLLAINISLFAAITIIKFLGIDVSLSYGLLFSIIIISGILRGILRYFEQYSNHYMAFKLLAIIRIKIFKSLRKLSLAKFLDKSKGDISQMLSSDVETLEVFYAHTITPILIALIVSLIMIIFLGIYINVYLALIALLTYLIIGIIIPLMFYMFNKNDGKKYRYNLGDFREFYLDSIYGGYEIISQNKKDEYIDLVKDKSDKLIKINNKLEIKNNIFTNITKIIIIMLNVLMIIISYILYINNIIDSPFIILSYVTLTTSLGPVLALANLPNNLAQTFASADRVFKLLNEKNNLTYGNLDFKFKNLEFKNVNFKYDKTDILRNCNFNLKNEEIIGILGPSGVGKSTILNLIMHFYEVNDGEILINNENIKKYSLESLYNNINLFSQKTYLFHDTILNNLKIAKSDATNEEITEACINAGIFDYIEGLKDGFNTKISDLKDNISEGEKQRLGLARVFLRKPKLLLLDEATANIDAINEGIILNSLKRYSKDMAIIIISHRKSSLSICNKIYEFKEGGLCQI